MTTKRAVTISLLAIALTGITLGAISYYKHTGKNPFKTYADNITTFTLTTGGNPNTNIHYTTPKEVRVYIPFNYTITDNYDISNETHNYTYKWEGSITKVYFADSNTTYNTQLESTSSNTMTITNNFSFITYDFDSNFAVIGNEEWILTNVTIKAYTQRTNGQLINSMVVNLSNTINYTPHFNSNGYTEQISYSQSIPANYETFFEYGKNIAYEIDTQQAYETGYQTGYDAGEYNGYQEGWNDNTSYSAPIDIRGLMLNILTMPFTFIRQGFDVTMWEGTAYEFNVANFILSLIAIATILFIIRLFTSGFSVIGNYTASKESKNLTRSKIEVNKATARRQNKLADKGK